MNYKSFCCGGAVVLCCFSTIASAANTAQQQFAEDNDLWQQDSLNLNSNIDEPMFNQIIEAAVKIYEPIAEQHKEALNIQAKWDDPTVNANTARLFGAVTINMYGGLARREEVTVDGFALVLCHELGHAYGGKPYINSLTRMSAEGQSDYYGARECLKNILPQITVAQTEVTPYTEKVCTEKYSTSEAEKNLCLRQLAAGQSLGALLAVMKKQAVPNYETPDPKVVFKTTKSYPATVQCRLDSYHNGALDLVRPACWFKK